MNINVYQQLFNFFVFIVTGIVIGILFDIFRVVRKSFKTPDYITYIQDIVFWLLSGSILLFAIFTFNNGEIRIYLFAGLILGLILYILTFSKYFIKINLTIVNFMKKIFYFPIYFGSRLIKKFIIQPVKFIFCKLKQKMTKWIKYPIKKPENMNFPNNSHKIGE